MIKKEDVEKVRAAADLYDIVSATVTLKPSGMAVFTLCTASAVPALAAPASLEAVSAVCKVKTVNISADEAGEGGEIREITFKDGMTGSILVNELTEPFTINAGNNGEYIVSISYK